MNEKVEKFLQVQKEIELQKKNKHLISLGIIDDSLAEKIYLKGSYSEEYAKYYHFYKDDKGWFKYGKGIKAVQVTDEEYAEICKYSPQQDNSINHEKEIISQLNSIRQMVKFFLILTIISLVAGVITCLAIFNLSPTVGYPY